MFWYGCTKNQWIWTKWTLVMLIALQKKCFWNKSFWLSSSPNPMAMSSSFQKNCINEAINKLIFVCLKLPRMNNISILVFGSNFVDEINSSWVNKGCMKCFDTFFVTALLFDALNLTGSLWSNVVPGYELSSNNY